jgi:hypothetical protein
VTIHLFGIDHADELHGIDLRELAGEAGESKNWRTEIGKGVRLAAYVRRKQLGQRGGELTHINGPFPELSPTLAPHQAASCQIAVEATEVQSRRVGQPQ